jgi:hypothetical protein
MTSSVRISATPVTMRLGRPCCRPRAWRSSDSTITKRVKLVIIMTITGSSPRMVIRTRICDLTVRPLLDAGITPASRSGAAQAAGRVPQSANRKRRPAPASSGAGKNARRPCEASWGDQVQVQAVEVDHLQAVLLACHHHFGAADGGAVDLDDQRFAGRARRAESRWPDRSPSAPAARCAPTPLPASGSPECGASSAAGGRAWRQPRRAPSSPVRSSMMRSPPAANCSFRFMSIYSASSKEVKHSLPLSLGNGRGEQARFVEQDVGPADIDRDHIAHPEVEQWAPSVISLLTRRPSSRTCSLAANASPGPRAAWLRGLARPGCCGAQSCPGSSPSGPGRARSRIVRFVHPRAAWMRSAQALAPGAPPPPSRHAPPAGCGATSKPASMATRACSRSTICCVKTTVKRSSVAVTLSVAGSDRTGAGAGAASAIAAFQQRQQQAALEGERHAAQVTPAAAIQRIPASRGRRPNSASSTRQPAQ